MVSMLSILTFAATVAALKITSPTSDDVWSTGESQTVTWDHVSTDQDSFNVYLSNMASYPTTTILLLSDVSASDGSATIDGSKLQTGDSFTINFTNGTETEQIYAQSNQFNITEGTTAASTSSAAAASSTAPSSTGSSTATATDATSTAASTGSATSSGSSASSSSSATSGAGKIVAGWMGVIALAAMAL
ncbi:unnamed protein product [Discula destructiva]